MAIAASLQSFEISLNKIITDLNGLKKQKKVWSKDISPLQAKLHDIDEKYQDGKFEDNGKIPEGQAALSDLLNEAHDLVSDLMEVCEDADEE